MGTLADALTFDVFDFDGSRDMPDNIDVNMPAKTEEEKKLLELQLAALERQAAPPTAEEVAMQTRATEYYNIMLGKEVLSPEEESMFDKEYELQLLALQEQFGMQTEELGGQRMAELASRGVLETTTGRDIIAKDQQKFTSVLAENVAGLGTAKEVAKSDMEAAKRQMAQQGYELTSGILQSRASDDMEQATRLQNYYTGENVLSSNNALQNALRRQQWGQWAYNQKMTSLGSITGIGVGMMKSGASG